MAKAVPKVAKGVVAKKAAKAPAAKAKGNAKAKAKVASTPASKHAAVAAVTPAAKTTKDADRESPADRERRDRKAKIWRAIGNRLDYVDVDMLENAVNADGETIEDFAGTEVDRLEGTGKYIKLEFWINLDKSFNLQKNATDDLEPASSDDEDDPELFEALLAAHSENPPSRKSEPFERIIAHCEPLSPGNVYGMLQMSQERPTLHKSLSMKMQTSICAYFARTEFLLIMVTLGSHSSTFQIRMDIVCF